MFKWIARLFAAVALPGDVQIIVGVIMGSGAIGALAAWLAWAQENPHWVIFIGVATFAACVWLFVGLNTLVRRFRVFRGIFLVSSEPFGVEIDKDERIFLPLKVTLRNVASRELHFKVSRAELELNGRTNKSVKMIEAQSSIPPGETATFRVAAVPGLQFEPVLSGSLEFEVEYGIKKDDLRYRLRYTFQPIFRFPTKPDEKQPQAPLIYDGANAISHHEKRRWI